MTLLKRGCMLIATFINSLYIKHFKISVGSTPIFHGIIKFSCEKKNSITLGNNIVINSGAKYNPIGGDTRAILRTVRDGTITIMNNVGISNSCVLSGGGGIVIEDNVLIGGGCKIYDNDFHSLNYNNRISAFDSDIISRKVLLKEGCFIGAFSIILKGVTIGKHSIVGAGSVVTKSIPDYEIWGGNPAVFIRKLVR